jgi:hypothetical protein
MASVPELDDDIIHSLGESRVLDESGNELVNPTTLMRAFAE